MISRDFLVEPFLAGTACFTHGITFGGHPVSCAVAMANLDIFDQEDLLAHVREHEAEFRAGLESLRDLPIVGDVRGAGYFHAIELVKDKRHRASRSPTRRASRSSAGSSRPGCSRPASSAGSTIEATRSSSSPRPWCAGPSSSTRSRPTLRTVLGEAADRVHGSGGRGGRDHGRPSRPRRGGDDRAGHRARPGRGRRRRSSRRCSTGGRPGRGRRRRARRWAQGRVSVDAAEPARARRRAAGRGRTVLVNAASYRLNLPAMEGALGAGCHYVDLGGLYHDTRRQLELDDRFAGAGLLAVLGMGASPGKTNLLARLGRRAARRGARAARRGRGDRSDATRATGLAAPYAIETILDELTLPAVVLRDGEAGEVPALADGGDERVPPAHRPAPVRLHAALRAGDVPRVVPGPARGVVPAVAGTGAGRAGRAARPVRAGRPRAGGRRWRERGAAGRTAGVRGAPPVPPSRPRTARPPCTWSTPRASPEAGRRRSGPRR